MKISELEEAYHELQEQSLRGELDEEEFKAEVERLRFEDDQGRQWKIGWYTGKWYRYDQGRWIQDTPHERQTPGEPTPVADSRPPTSDGRARRPAAFWLALLLVGLLVLTGATLVVGWNAGWWGSPTETPTKGVAVVSSNTPLPPTDTQRPTTTPSALPTLTPQATRQATPTPSQTPRPTAVKRTATTPPTATSPAASPTTSPTASPTASPTHTPTEAAGPTPSPLPPATPALSGRIFFPVYDPDRQTFDIHTVRLQDGERKVVVRQASQPALSPNGRRLAYRSWDRAQRGILVRELADGHTWVWINFAEAARPSWSPDSENIVFPSQQESDRQWRLYRSLGIEFDHVRRHGGDIYGRVPAWLADGRIAYWECPVDKCGLYVMQSDGTQPIRLTEDEHDTAPAASPDGSRLAFMTDKDGNWEIYVVSTAPAGDQGRQEPQRLTRNPARDGLPTWSPDGRWLAFVTDRDGQWAVWAMRPDGSDPRKLFDLGGPLEGEITYVLPGDQHGWTWEAIAWGP